MGSFPLEQTLKFVVQILSGFRILVEKHRAHTAIRPDKLIVFKEFEESETQILVSGVGSMFTSKHSFDEEDFF